MRSDKANRMVDYGISELERVAPNNAEIEVDVKEDPVGHYSALIKVKANHKVYFIKKEADSMYDSFHKAVRALKVQLSKHKNNHRVFRNLHFQ